MIRAFDEQTIVKKLKDAPQYIEELRRRSKVRKEKLPQDQESIHQRHTASEFTADMPIVDMDSAKKCMETIHSCDELSKKIREIKDEHKGQYADIEGIVFLRIINV
jgi:hypothetical protein